MKNGFSRGSRQQAKASRPDGRNAWRKLAKEQRRLGEEHHAEARGQQIEACGIERIDGRVRQHEIDRQARGRDLRAPAPASARKCRCRAHARSGRPFAPARSRWRRCRSRHRRSARRPRACARSIRTSATGASRMSCDCCRSAQRWPPGPFQYAIWSAFRSWPAGVSMCKLVAGRFGFATSARQPSLCGLGLPSRSSQSEGW